MKKSRHGGKKSKELALADADVEMATKEVDDEEVDGRVPDGVNQGGPLSLVENPDKGIDEQVEELDLKNARLSEAEKLPFAEVSLEEYLDDVTEMMEDN